MNADGAMFCHIVNSLVRGAAAVGEPPFCAGPFVDGGVAGLVCPIEVPWTGALVSGFAPGAVGHDAGVDAASFDVPAIHLKDILRIGARKAGNPRLVERVRPGESNRRSYTPLRSRSSIARGPIVE